MNARDIAIKFFKRNPKAKAAHVVLDRATDDLNRATLFQKSVYAKKVSSFTRKECMPESNNQQTEESQS